MKIKKITPALESLTFKLLSRWPLREIRDACGVKASQNVWKWKDVGNVPLQFRASILQLANDTGVELLPIEIAYLTSKERVPIMGNLDSSAIAPQFAGADNPRSPYRWRAWP
jgi:hypothetical protein